MFMNREARSDFLYYIILYNELSYELMFYDLRICIGINETSDEVEK